MTGFLLDTNVISELRRLRPEAKVLNFFTTQPIEALFISTVTIAEIRFGIEQINSPMRRAELTDWLTQKIRPIFERRILPITEDVMLKWRLLVETGRKSNFNFSQPDLLIAATALCHGLTVISRDTRAFARASADVHNPWT